MAAAVYAIFQHAQLTEADGGADVREAVVEAELFVFVVWGFFVRLGGEVRARSTSALSWLAKT